MHFILNLRVIAYFILMRQVFSKVFLFYLGIEVSVSIHKFTHSIKQPCGRCNIKFFHDIVFKFCKIYIENVKNCSPRMQTVEITL